MAKPEEVIIVEDNNGEILRETTRDTFLKIAQKNPAASSSAIVLRVSVNDAVKPKSAHTTLSSNGDAEQPVEGEEGKRSAESSGLLELTPSSS
eukprot:gene14303-15818_t